MTDRPWFDRETGTLMLDEYVLEMDSYRRIVEDETITDDELVEQTQRVASLLRRWASWRCSTPCKSSACRPLRCYRSRGESSRRPWSRYRQGIDTYSERRL